MEHQVKRIVIMASGAGTNAANIITQCQQDGRVEVVMLLCNKKESGVYAVGEKYNVPVQYISRADLYDTHAVTALLQTLNPDLIVLAGFLWLVPSDMVAAFPQHIINIHPALLPRHGGHGMYGDKVHEAVKLSGDTRTGITIHYVNNNYDEGAAIYQATCPVSPTDTPADVAKNVHALEYTHYPQVIFKLLGLNHDLLDLHEVFD